MGEGRMPLPSGQTTIARRKTHIPAPIWIILAGFFVFDRTAAAVIQVGQWHKHTRRSPLAVARGRNSRQLKMNGDFGASERSGIAAPPN